MIFHDMNTKVLDSDSKHQIDFLYVQEVPDWFYERNRERREASRLIPIGELHAYANPPIHTWEQLKKLYPGLELDKPVKGIEAAKERANAVMDALRAMGEERCITTVHRF